QSAEKSVLEEKQGALRKNMEWRSSESVKKISAEDLRTWQEVVEDLRVSLNEHSFTAFIEPLRFDSMEGDRVFLSAPPDSVTWVSDHYAERIGACYRDRTGKNISVEVR
ncbi:MAG: DnaA N-terminal domain-containing protein, partial [Candidatus Latescibacterota bacterium]